MNSTLQSSVDGKSRGASPGPAGTEPGGVADYGLSMLKHWQTMHRHAAQLRAMHLKKCRRTMNRTGNADRELSALWWGACALGTEAEQLEPSIVRAGGLLLLVAP